MVCGDMKKLWIPYFILNNFIYKFLELEKDNFFFFLPIWIWHIIIILLLLTIFYVIFAKYGWKNG
ncbi:MAG: hypothetical protein DRN11_02770 [Thermoplasmata archaeon]|nr:MAG: hypothetical protein DRN11_02770 [Thermoplasmata archaeon]